MRDDARWLPLASEPLASRARAAVAEIASSLDRAAHAGAIQGCSLGDGTAGVGVALAHLGQAEARERCLDLAVEEMAVAPLAPGLLDGFAGIGWAVAQVTAVAGGTVGDGLEQVDQTLLEWVRTPSARREYELARGVAGVGVYALRRLADHAGRACLEAVVESLAELAENRRGGARWRTPYLGAAVASAQQPGAFNLGMAHGVPGVIALLAAACRADVAQTTAAELLDGAVPWLLAQGIETPEGTRFPYTAGGEPARLAWCYGDLGVASAILAAAAARDSDDWRRAAREIARGAARREPADTGILDAGLCHGAAGAAHVFGRLASATGDEVLAEAAVQWLERTLDMDRPAESGLLTGAAGVALALHAATSDDEPTWDRFLLP